MLVYRFENAKGEGVYQSLRVSLEGIGVDYESYLDLFCADDLHPRPVADWLENWYERDDYQDFLFGFLDLKQVFTWFDTKQRKVLAKLGVKLCAYETTHVLFGGRQLVFKGGKKLCEVELAGGYSKAALTKQIKVRLKSVEEV